MNSCTIDGCVNTHRARGLCITHYNQQRYGPDRHAKMQVPCSVCAAVVVKERRTLNYRPVCSLLCRHWLTHGTPAICRVPASHPSRYVTPVLVIRPAVVTKPCGWCGTDFQTTKSVQTYCTRRCKQKHMRVRRRGNEAGSPIAYTWTEVMRVFLAFDRCCAYCEQAIDGQPEPDHVVPLSRHGSNGLSNILPACHACNADKRELLLTEWNADRARRGLPPRTVEWVSTDLRVSHLRRELRDAA